MEDEIESLYHYGVKGMRWGHRKDDAVLGRIAGYKMIGETKEDRQRYKEYKKTTPRKARRADRDTAIAQYALKLLDDSMTSPDNLVQVGTPGYPTLMLGKEFVAYLGSGGSFNPMTTVVTDLKPGGGA